MKLLFAEWLLYFALLNFIVLAAGCAGKSTEEICQSTCMRPCQYCSIGRYSPQSCLDCRECKRACEASHGAA